MQTLKQQKLQLLSDYRQERISELHLEGAIEINGGAILDDIWKATLGGLLTITYNFGKAIGGWLERLLD